MQDCLCIVPNIERGAILVGSGRGGDYLPTIYLPEQRTRFFPDHVPFLRRVLEEDFGVESIVLRHLFESTSLCVCEFECLCINVVPEPFRWIAYAQLARLHWRDEQHAERGLQWSRAFMNDHHSPLRAPWEKRGWYAATQALIGSELQCLHIDLTGKTEQTKGGWGLSSILCANTNRGLVYLKAGPKGSRGEPRTLVFLRKRWPENLPKLLAVDVDQNWMLMEDFGSFTIENAGLEEGARCVRLYAEMQRDYATRIPELAEIGCTIVTGSVLADAFELIMSDPTLFGQGVHKLEEDEVHAIRSLTPYLRRQCQALDDAHVPLSVHNEDFREGNVALCNNRPVFYDWANTSVAHPFLSINYFLNRHCRPANVNSFTWRTELKDANRIFLRDAYLQPWMASFEHDRLLAEFELTRNLFFLHEAFRCSQMLPYLEEDTPWWRNTRSYIPRCLRDLLRMTKQHNDGN